MAGDGSIAPSEYEVNHPVLADRLSVMRDRNTRHGDFRQAMFEAAAIIKLAKISQSVMLKSSRTDMDFSRPRTAIWIWTRVTCKRRT